MQGTVQMGVEPAQAVKNNERQFTVKLEPRRCLVPGRCDFVSRRRMNIPSYRESMERALDMLFPEGLPQPVKNPLPRPSRPPRPLRRPAFGRRWNDPIQALLSVVNDPLPKPLFPYWRRWRNQRQLRQYRALGLGLMRKLEWIPLNDPSFLNAEQNTLNALFPKGVPQPVRPLPPQPQIGRFLWPRSRRGEIATRSCKYRFLSVRK